MYAFRKYLHYFFVATLSYLTLGRSYLSHHSCSESLHTTALPYAEYTISLFLFTASSLLSLLWWSLSLGRACEMGIKFRAEHSIISYTPHTEKLCISSLIFAYYTHRERTPSLIGVERDVIIYRYNNKPLEVDWIQWPSRKIAEPSSPRGVRTYIATVPGSHTSTRLVLLHCGRGLKVHQKVIDCVKNMCATAVPVGLFC